MKILILCTGNSCRSQMAHEFLQSLDSRITVFSAGTRPAARVNPWAIAVMREVGIDISHHIPKMIKPYLAEEWDYVITVCDNANQSCPHFPGKVTHRLHLRFDDPSLAHGDDDLVLKEFRRIRNQIIEIFSNLYRTSFKPELE